MVLAYRGQGHVLIAPQDVLDDALYSRVQTAQTLSGSKRPRRQAARDRILEIAGAQPVDAGSVDAQQLGCTLGLLA